VREFIIGDIKFRSFLLPGVEISEFYIFFLGEINPDFD